MVAWTDRTGHLHALPADAPTRLARQQAHAAFDPLWQRAKRRGARSRAYRWLARELGMPVEQCHIGWFDAATCARVIELSRLELQQRTGVAP